jgi:hypothetical protein
MPRARAARHPFRSSATSCRFCQAVDHALERSLGRGTLLAGHAGQVPNPLLGWRRRDADLDLPLDVGAELNDGGNRYRVERVEPPPNRPLRGSPGASRLDGA